VREQASARGKLTRCEPPRALCDAARRRRSFCKVCITQWRTRSATCPLDRAALTHTIPNRGLRASVEALLLRCPNEPPAAAPEPPSKKRSREARMLREGADFAGSAAPAPRPPPRCGWSGALGALAAHLAACKLHKVPCRWQHQGCEESVLRRALAAHEAQCEYRTAACALCGENIFHDEMELHLSDVCEAALVTCAARCGAQVPRAQLEAHAAVCPNEPVSCPVHGCGKQLLRCQLEEHVRHTSKAHVRLLAAHFTQLLAEAEEQEAEDEDEDY
jgi:hypothetical protein